MTQFVIRDPEEVLPCPAEERLYVLVPCFNEEQNVRAAVSAVLEVAGDLAMKTGLILIDDGSTDSTLEVMKEIADANPSCAVWRNERNLGLGRSILRCLGDLPARAWITVYPGDNEFLFSSVHNFLEEKDRHDLILGYLHNPVVRPLSRRIASSMFTRLVCFFYGFPWRYLNGMKLYRAEVFQGLDVSSSGHAFMAEAIAKAQLRSPRLRICEVPFYSQGRSTGRSKAMRPHVVLREVFQVVKGMRAVNRYRRDVILGRPDKAA